MSVRPIARAAALAGALLFPLAAVRPPVAAGTEAAPASPRAEPRPECRPPSALWLFAAVEEAWGASDAERLAALVDTATVRIALKPGTPPTAAVTRSAAAFLFQDQLRLVKTQQFR